MGTRNNRLNDTVLKHPKHIKMILELYNIMLKKIVYLNLCITAILHILGTD